MIKHLSFQTIRIVSIGSLLFFTLMGGGLLFIQLQGIVTTISEPIQEQRPYLNKVFNLQKAAADLDLQLHNQLKGEIIEISAPIQLIDNIIQDVELLTSENLFATDDLSNLEAFAKELKRLKIALIYYRDNKIYDSASSSTEELFEIIDETLGAINHNLRSFISHIRQHIAESDEMVLEGAHSILKNLMYFLAVFVSGTFGVFYLFNKVLTHKLKELVAGTKHLGEGNYEWKITSKSDDEFGQLSAAFNDMADKIAGAKVKLVAQAEELQGKINQLAETNEKLDLIFNLVPGIISTAGTDGYFKSVNPALEKLLGFSKEELLSRPILDFVHPEDQHPVKKEHLEGIGGRRLRSFENRYLCKDGSYRLLKWYTTSAVDGILYAAGRDITGQRLAEAEREKMIGELQKALEEIKTLQGIIPICMYCKNIKSDEGTWDRMEKYIEEHSDADFSHGICPDCYKKQLEELEKESLPGKQADS